MKLLILSAACVFTVSAHARYGEMDRTGSTTYWKSCDGKGTCSEGDTAQDAVGSCNQISNHYCRNAVRVRVQYRFDWFDKDYRERP